jgi:hypothetical protein
LEHSPSENGQLVVKENVICSFKTATIRANYITPPVSHFQVFFRLDSVFSDEVTETR